MQHHTIKSLLFSAPLSKVHRTFFTLALGAMLLTGCSTKHKAVVEEALCADLRSRSRERIQQFTQEKVSRELYNLYCEVLKM